MNWFNLKDLENRLIENQVSDQEGFYYLLANFILFGLTSYGGTQTYNHSAFLYAEIILILIITIVGLNLTFKVNKSGDGDSYFKRFLALYFVIGIRLIVFIFLLAIPVGILAYIIFGENSPGEMLRDGLFLGFLTAVMTVYYYFIIRSFKKVALSNLQ